MTRDTTPTDRRAYERPEIGDDWAQAWDELVEDLDSASLYVDSTDNTSETDPIPGTTHFEDVDAESVNTGELTSTDRVAEIADGFVEEEVDHGVALGDSWVRSDESYAIGQNNETNGSQQNFAFGGNSALAEGTSSTAGGRSAVASGVAANAYGYRVEALRDRSWIIGSSWLSDSEPITVETENAGRLAAQQVAIGVRPDVFDDGDIRDNEMVVERTQSEALSVRFRDGAGNLTTRNVGRGEPVSKHDSLQGAIDAAGSNSAVIIDQDIQEHGIEPNDNQEIFGIRPTIEVDTGGDRFISASSPAQNVTLRNFTVSADGADRNIALNDASRWTLDGLTLEGATDHAFNDSGSGERFQVRNCEVYDAPVRFLDDNSDSYMANCIVDVEPVVESGATNIQIDNDSIVVLS